MAASRGGKLLWIRLIVESPTPENEVYSTILGLNVALARSQNSEEDKRPRVKFAV